MYSQRLNGCRERIRATDDATCQRYEWPAAQALPDGLPDVPPFAAELLPAVFRGWVLDAAERMQCPPDFPAIAVMIAAGSVIGRQIAIRPKRRDDWTVVPDLWGAAIGRPSVMESPALHEALMPLVAMEAAAAEQHREALADWEADQVVAKEAEKVNAAEIRKLIKGKKPAEAQALARQDLQSDDAPTRRRYVVNDTTVEKLGLILAANPSGVLIFRDELTGFLRAMDRDGHEQDRAFYLESWNGCGRFTVDRVGRGTLDIEACCVSILGGVQPGPLSDYLLGAVRQGAADDGFIQRFQLGGVARCPRNLAECRPLAGQRGQAARCRCFPAAGGNRAGSPRRRARRKLFAVFAVRSRSTISFR